MSQKLIAQIATTKKEQQQQQVVLTFECNKHSWHVTNAALSIVLKQKKEKQVIFFQL